MARVQGDTLAPYLFIICWGYVLWMSISLIKEDDLTIKMIRSRWYPTEAMTNADNADDLVLLTNTPAQAKSQQHSLEQAARGIGLYVNAGKTKLCFKQVGTIFTFEPLKIVDHLTYLSSYISSTEINFN